MTLLQPRKNPLKTQKPTFFQIYQVKSPVKFQSFHPKFNILFYRLFTKTQQLKIKTYFHWPLVKAVNYTKITRKIKCPPTASLHINNLESALKPNSHVIYTYFITGKVDVKKYVLWFSRLFMHLASWYLWYWSVHLWVKLDVFRVSRFFTANASDWPFSSDKIRAKILDLISGNHNWQFDGCLVLQSCPPARVR